MRNRPPADLFARLPGHYRTRDAEEGRPLEALMALLSEELNTIEQDLDQLYDNWFVETCEAWVLPYIAALVGASPMRDIGEDQAGLLRAYIANVLQFRQAKGTAAAVEQVAREVSGWPVVAVEFFQRVATSQHMNHVRRDAVVFADIRNTGKARTSRSAFSTMAHTAAAGSPSGWSGRYNIPHLGLFIWRQAAEPLGPIESNDSPYKGGPQAFASASEPGLLRFDPLGRDLHLCNRPEADQSVAARMTARTVPALLQRSEVFETLNAVRSDGTSTGRWFEKNPPFLVRLNGHDVPLPQLFACDLSKTAAGLYRRPSTPGDVLVDPELGRISLHPDDQNKTVETAFAQCSTFDIGGGAYDRRESMERWLPDFTQEDGAELWHLGVTQIAAHVTNNPDQGGPVVSNLREAIKRWNAHSIGNPGARGIITVLDSATYNETLNGTRRIILSKGSKLAIVAAAWPAEEHANGTITRRPAAFSPMHRRPCITKQIMVDSLDAGQEKGGDLIIDGFIICQRIKLRESADLNFLGLYNCTVGANADGLETESLDCTKDNERTSITLHRCILAPLNLTKPTGKLSIFRSIIGEDRSADGGSPATQVIQAPHMDAEISGSTLFGRATLRTIEAENSLLLGSIRVKHKQTGCVRYCYTAPNSLLPRRYLCIPKGSGSEHIKPLFTSTRFIHSEFGRLSLRAPQEIREGAEDGMEMGVGFANRNPARLANILDAVEEFAPVGETPGIIFVT